MPLLIIISAAIGGFLIAIVAIVIAMTWWKITKRKAADPASSWPKTSHQITPDRVSTSSQESNLQSSNTTSSMSTVDELEDEFRSNSDNSLKPRNYSHSNYSDYRQFRSEQDLLDHAAKYSPDYHNPYLQTITPTSDYTSSGTFIISTISTQLRHNLYLHRSCNTISIISTFVRDRVTPVALIISNDGSTGDS